MPDYLGDPVAEIMDIMAYEARRARLQQQASQVTPEVARLVSSYARTSPWISPGVNLGLSRMGIGPNDPRVESISKLALGSEPLGATSANSYGEQVKATELRPTGFLGAAIGRAVGTRPTSQQQEAQELQEQGWNSLENITAEHPELQALVDTAGLAIEDGMIVRATNKNSTRYSAYKRLVRGFLEAGVKVPFMTEDGRPGVVQGEDDIKWLDDQPPPVEEDGGTGGMGQFGAMGQQRGVPGVLRSPRRDTPMQEKLRAAGLNIDPADPLSPMSFITRPAAMAMDMPAQELQGQFRNVIAATSGKPVNWTESQSDMGIMLGASMKGQTLDPGSGYFINPDSEIARIRREREAKRGHIGRHNITLGRWLADTVTEPDTAPFNVLSGTVDAGVQVADPTTWALGKAGSIRKARSLFEAADAASEAAGLIPGLRRAIHGPTAAQWLNSDAGIKSLESLAGETSPARIWAAMGRRTDPALAARLADAPDTASVSSILEEFLGPHIRTPAELEAAGKSLASGVSPLDSPASRLNPRHSRSRLWEWMPGPSLDTSDPRQFATHLERHMVNAKVPTPLIEEVLNDVARAETSNGLFEAATKAMAHEQGVLVQSGVTPENARTLTTLFRDNYQSTVDDLTEEIGDDSPVWTEMFVGGELTEIPSPHLSLEHVGRYIPLPEPRRIRRLTSNPAFRFLTTTKSPTAFGQNRFPVAMVDFLQQEVWKTSTLIGRFPAWISRVVGESQIRIATANLDGLFRHPIDFFAIALGKKLSKDPMAMDWEDIDEFRGTLTSANGGWIQRPGASRSSRPVIIPKKPEFQSQFRDAWADELSLLHHDPVSKMVLKNGLEETERWLMVSDEGKRILKGLREARPGSLVDAAAVQEYLRSVSRRITLHTGGDTALIDAVKTGQLDGIPLQTLTNRTNPKFAKALESRLDVAPAKMKGQEWDIRRAGVAFPERWQRGVDWMFANTMGRADNFMDRAPVMKQFTWGSAMELLPFADPAAQVRILRNARAANLPRRMMKGLEKAAQRNTPDGLNAEELTMLARGYGADKTKKLLYDLAERGQLADAARIVAPFANAYQEIFGAWSKLLNEMGGPGTVGKALGAAKVLRRTQQIVEGARGEDFGSTMGAPAGEGFFHKDEFGQEVFVIPGSQWLTQSLTGVPVPLTGSVQGLNMVGSIIPGIGPAAAIPTAWIIQDKPQLNGLHDLLIPYGAPGERQKGDMANLLNYAPPWTRRMFDSLTGGGYDQRLWANTQKDAMAYLFSTGEYDISTREGLNELTQDAKDAAKDLYRVRAGVQFFSPTTPSFRFLIEDKTGSLLAMSVAVEDYYNLQEANYETASQTFMDLYGEDAILAVIPKSGATTYGLPRNLEQRNFVLNNPELKKNFPSTYGLFLPQTDDFDYEVYLQNFISGDREDLSVDQWIALGNSMRGDMLFQRYKEQIGTRTDKPARDWLAEVRRRIMETFPSGPTGLPEKPDTDQMIMEMYQALDNPAAAATDAGQGMALYFGYRDQALAAAEGLGRRSFNQSDDTQYLREWLNEVAEKVIEKHPDFQYAWDIVLSREARLEE